MGILFRQKIGLVAAGLLCSLVTLELTLRLAGFGYNLRYRPPQEGAADFKIFCIGESSTWGSGAKDPTKDSYPKQLERLLAERYPRKKIRCFYDQTIGQNTSEILLKLPSYIKRHEPNLIIFMVGVNNWWNMDKSNIFLFNKNAALSNVTLRTMAFLDSLRVWKLFKWIRFSLGCYKQKWDYWWPQGVPLSCMMRRTVEAYGEKIWDVCNALAAHDLEEMIKICKANHIEVIVSSYPGGTMKGLGLIQKAVAEKFGVFYVSNYFSFRDLPNREEYFSSDRWHPNEKGYALLARNIFNCIVRNKLLE